MKILFVINFLSNGGAERVAARLCDEWSLNNDIVIAKTSFYPNDQYMLPDRIQIINLCEKHIRNKLIVAIRLRKLIKQTQPNVVVSFIDSGHLYTTIAKIGLNIVHVCSERNNPYVSPSNPFLRVARLIAFKRANGVVFQTNGAKDFFQKYKLKSTIIIENPIGEVPTAKGIFTGKLISVGRLEKQKNFDLLIDSFYLSQLKYKEISLSIYGNGSLKNQLIKKIQFLGLSDKIIIYDFDTNILDIMAQSNIFIMTSSHEGFSNALLEALSIGLPTVVTDSSPGAAKEVTRFLMGSILVEQHEPTKISEAINLIIGDYDFYKEKANFESLSINQKYNIKCISTKWIDYFKSL